MVPKPFNLKLNIRAILPIIFAVALPGLGLYSNSLNSFEQQFTWLQRWAFSSAVMLILWFLYWHFVDISNSPKRWLPAVAFVLLVGLGIALVQPMMFKFAHGIQWLSLARMMVGSILILTMQYALKTQANNARLRLEKEQMQTENYKVQLKALSTKIDPHFLFNSLNTLRSMVRHQNGNSEEFIVSMSDFYRQILKHNEDTTLPLSDELAVLNSYLFLMKNRNVDAVEVHISIDKALHQHHLPTLGLQTVVENCFKHNSMTSKKPLKIDIQSTKDGYVEVTNNIQPKLADKEPTGIGLNLIRKRYELIHVNNGVIINNTPDQYTTKLKLIKL